MIAPWILCIYLLLSFAGGANPNPLATAIAVGVFLFLIGSWMNSYAEYTDASKVVFIEVFLDEH